MIIESVETFDSAADAYIILSDSAVTSGITIEQGNNFGYCGRQRQYV